MLELIGSALVERCWRVVALVFDGLMVEHRAPDDDGAGMGGGGTSAAGQSSSERLQADLAGAVAAKA